MNLSWINPALWPLLGLSVVPLLVHLFSRTRPPVYVFSSVEFLQRVVRKTMRIRKPQDWLVLLLRTLLALFLLLAFLRPVMHHPSAQAFSGKARNMIIIMDRSASMAYSNGAQTRLAMACAEASDMLADLSSRDRANIVWLDASPHAELPTMAGNFNYLVNALRHAAPSHESGNLGQAMAEALRLLRDSKDRREIYIFSDFQKTAWENQTLVREPGVEIYKVKVGEREASNGAITDFFCSPATPLAGEELSIYCEVQNFSSGHRSRTVFLQVGQARQSQSVMLQPWGRSTVVFRTKVEEPGWLGVRTSLNEDAFPADDSRQFAIRVLESLTISLAGKDASTLQHWANALNILPWAEFVTFDPDDTAHPNVLLIAGGGDDAAKHIQSQLESGGLVICQPAGGMEAGDLPGSWTAGPLKAEASEQGFRLTVADEQDPALEVFQGGRFGDPARANFKQRLEILPAEDAPKMDTLLRYRDGIPALTRTHHDKGTFVLWNMPMGKGLTDLPSMPEFLPLLAETILTSRPPQTGTTGYAPGDSLSLETLEALPESDIELKNAAGHKMPLEVTRTAGITRFISPPITTPSLYTWSLRGTASELAAVNFPSTESDLRPLKPDAINQRDATAVITAGQVRQLHEGLELWPWLLGLAMLVVIMEGGVLAWAEQN